MAINKVRRSESVEQIHNGWKEFWCSSVASDPSQCGSWRKDKPFHQEGKENRGYAASQ